MPRKNAGTQRPRQHSRLVGPALPAACLAVRGWGGRHGHAECISSLPLVVGLSSLLFSMVPTAFHSDCAVQARDRLVQAGDHSVTEAMPEEEGLYRFLSLSAGDPARDMLAQPMLPVNVSCLRGYPRAPPRVAVAPICCVLRCELVQRTCEAQEGSSSAWRRGPAMGRGTSLV